MNNLQDIVKVSKRLKLLYVEDNEEVREITLSFLKEFFDSIVIAKNGLAGFNEFYNLNIEKKRGKSNTPHYYRCQYAHRKWFRDG